VSTFCLRRSRSGTRCGTGDTAWWPHRWTTTLEIIGAFFLAAVVGVRAGRGHRLVAADGQRAVCRVPGGSSTPLPKVAIAPLFLIWMGYGIFPNMLMGALIGFFPVVINTAVGP